MIKKILSSVLLFTLALSANAQQTFKIQGTQSKEVTTAKYLIYLADENYNLPKTANDSIIVKKGKIQYSTRISQLLPVIILKTDANGNPTRTYIQTFFIPGATMTLQATTDGLKMGGNQFYKQSQQLEDTLTPASDAIQKAIGRYQAIRTDNTIQDKEAAQAAAIQEYNDSKKAFMNTVQDYFNAHKAEEGCVVSLVQSFRDGKYYQEADETVKNGQFKQYLEQYTTMLRKAREEREAQEKAAQEAASKSATGQMFTDFQAEYEGKTYKLSDYVGRGKYVLVDFWASWCGPCKAEIPNLIKVYNQYKGDKFEVLGVATWDEPKATLKAIEQMQIPYPQILNAQKAGSDAYGITGIPQIILFGPDGTIIKRDLRGEQIEETIKELLK